MAFRRDFAYRRATLMRTAPLTHLPRLRWRTWAVLPLLLLLSACPAFADVAYIYDDLGRLVGVVDPTGDTVTYTYDAVGNLLAVSRQSSSLVSIIDFTPKSGPVGTPVTISGTGFSTTPSQNSVAFNGTSATVTSSTATQIVTTVPAGATTGPITVTAPGGSATSATPFTVTAGSGAPTVTGFSPGIATPGSAVTITGTNFEASPANNKVKFNRLRLSVVNSTTATTIGTSVPSSVGSGRISVTTPAGSTVSSGDFFIPPSPYTAADVQVTGRIAIGETRTVTISSPGKIGLIVFDAAAGQRIGVFITNVTILSATVELRQPDGSVLASATVGTSGGSIPLQTLPVTGTYTLFARPAANNVGQMDLQVGARDLAISNLVVGTIKSHPGGGYDIPVTFTVTNVGSATIAASWSDRGYLSTDAVLQDTDQVLSGYYSRTTDLAPGASYAASLTFTTTATTAAGTYTLFVKTDGGADSSGQYSPTGVNYVTELGETNNVTVTNVGTTTATARWYDRGYLSTDAVLHDADQVLGSFNTRTTDLAPGASYAVSLTFTTTATTAAGTYTLFVKTDGGADNSGRYSPTGANYVTEASETNNVASVPVSLNADLAISDLTVGAVTPRTGGGYNIPVTFTVTNVGTTAAGAPWYDRGYLSTDAVLQDTDQLLSGYYSRTTDLGPSASYTASLTFTTTAATAAGNYTLFVKTDGGTDNSGRYSPTGANYVMEPDEANNFVSAAVVLP